MLASLCSGLLKGGDVRQIARAGAFKNIAKKTMTMKARIERLKKQRLCKTCNLDITNNDEHAGECTGCARARHAGGAA